MFNLPKASDSKIRKFIYFQIQTNIRVPRDENCHDPAIKSLLVICDKYLGQVGWLHHWKLLMHQIYAVGGPKWNNAPDD